MNRSISELKATGYERIEVSSEHDGLRKSAVLIERQLKCYLLKDVLGKWCLMVRHKVRISSNGEQVVVRYRECVGVRRKGVYYLYSSKGESLGMAYNVKGIIRRIENL